MTAELYAASLALSVTAPLSERRLERAREWLRAVARQSAEVVLPMLTLDVATILIDGPKALVIPEVGPSGDLRTALAAYAEHVIGRLRGDAALGPLLDAVADTPNRTAAVQVVVSRIGSALASEDRVMDVGVARRQVERPAGELVAAAFESLENPVIRDRLSAVLLSMVRAAKRRATLLRPSDAFVVRHLQALRTPSDQLAFEQVADAATALGHWVPRRVRSQRPPAGSTPTTIRDDSVYPVGGYSSLATHGPIENLVSSELVYLEPEADLDLFDLRYAASELLKYTRDESVWTRAHRRIDLVLMPSALALRVKVTDLPYQHAVMTQAAVVIATDRLLDWLSADDLEISVWVVDPNDAHRDDVARLRLRLADPVTLGVVRIDSVPTADVLSAHALAPEDRIVFRGADDETALEGLHVVVHGDGRCEFGVSNAAGLTGWAQTLTAVLATLI